MMTYLTTFMDEVDLEEFLAEVEDLGFGDDLMVTETEMGWEVQVDEDYYQDLEHLI